MDNHHSSVVARDVASTVLPSAEIIRLPIASPKRANPVAFTRPALRKMLCPSGQREKFYWDRACRGLGLRALSSGRQSWVYQYRDEHGRTRRIALGDVSAVSLDAAREQARRHAASVAQGHNPSAARKSKRTAGSVLELIEAYLAHAKTRQRPRSFKETERHLRTNAAPLHHDRAEVVGRRDIGAVLERIVKGSGPVAANRVRATLSAMWGWGLRTGLVNADHNPVIFTIRQPEKARERTLADAELLAIWGATEQGDDYSRIVRLCLLTGCRREEIAGLRWGEIQDNVIIIGPGRMKGNAAHEITLLPMIKAALPARPTDAAEYVFGRAGTGFSGFSDGKEKLDAKLVRSGVKLEPWGLHDLRRTFSTRLHDAGIAPIIVEALLAHKQQGVAAVYNRASFRDAKRAALKRWHRLLTRIISHG